MSREHLHSSNRRLAAVGILVVAALFRFTALARDPLSAPEAGRAWFAWSLAQEQLTFALERLRPAEPSPLLESLQFGLASVGVDSDWSARLPGALAGVALVLVLLRCAPRFGTGGALAFAALAAVDPTLIAISRRQGDVALGLLVGALVLLPWLSRALAVECPSAPPRLERSWALALGGLVAAGWSAWATLPLLALGLPCGKWAADGSSTPGFLARPERSAVQLGWIFLGLGSASTAAFVAWPLLPELSASLTSFLAHFAGGCPEVTAPTSIGILLAADPIVFVLGPVALLLLG
ncbi:MAG: hypothetical protein ABIU84_17875, partial [Thermoanaerobaculia bacterium]